MKSFLKRVFSKQTGFTLIELLVVIAIIGILAAIIVPNVSQYITGGTDAAAASELKIVQNGVSAAMASAKVGTLTAANTEPDIDADNDTAEFSSTKEFSIIGSKTVKVGDYLTNGNADVKGTYSISATGAVRQITKGQ